MTPKEQAAMQQALKVMRGINHGTDWNNGTHAAIYRPMFPGAITELEEALAQPQGSWVDLTDDEIKTAYESWWETHDNHAFPIWVGAKAAIAKFKSKNTPPVVPQGEPVAWMFCLDGCNQVVLDEDSDSVIRHNGTPLVPAPQPVKELTDDEIDRIACNVSHKEFARAVIAADREKNK